MSYVHSFPPIAAADSRVLILGTMPGKESLRQQQYYAHSRNAFWKIVGEIFDFSGIPDFNDESSYDARASSLSAAGVALWDVLKLCTRESSLDSDIDPDTIEFNDFAAFFASHPHIHKVYFNGAKAEEFYRKYEEEFYRERVDERPDIKGVRLPSTSPANAAIPFAEKLHAWRVVAA